MSESTIVCIGCSTDADYVFLAPLGALLWRDLVRFEPRLFLVGDAAEWQNKTHTRASLNAMHLHGIGHRFIGRLPGYRDSTLAQNIRQHAACDPSIAPDTWCAMSDADLWPLRRDFYVQHESSDARCVLLYANGDHFAGAAETLRRAAIGQAYQSIPTCHVIMRAATWRETYRYISSDPVASMAWTLGRWLNPKMRKPGNDPGWEAWMSDQRKLTEALCEQPWFPEFRVDDKNRDGVYRVGDVLFVTRHGHPPLDRLDRSLTNDWKVRPYYPRWTDAHLHKNPFNDEHWNDTLPVIEYHMPQHLEWARRYREEFVAG